MDIFSVEFASALLTIVVIDLVLAGDNPIVIALAARSLPPALRKKAVIWGTIGAIVVRAAMTLVVVWLLMAPGLRFLGGLALVWIAYKLLVPSQAKEGAHGKSADNFWSAMKTIVVADALMGLDNVLAVAGAARGSFPLVVLGLLISIPIVVWGSTLILKWVDRFPVIVCIGAGVLAWTAAQMMLHEPVIMAHVQDRGPLKVAVYLLVIIGVLLAGFQADKRRRQTAPKPSREAL
jgi:YjbE family integral membrane protein